MDWQAGPNFFPSEDMIFIRVKHVKKCLDFVIFRFLRAHFDTMQLVVFVHEFFELCWLKDAVFIFIH